MCKCKSSVFKLKKKDLSVIIIKIIELNVYQDNRILSIIKKWSVRNASFNKQLYNTEFSCFKNY